jgi:hypothetical protein
MKPILISTTIYRYNITFLKIISSDGIPCTTTSLTEIQTEAGKPL